MLFQGQVGLQTLSNGNQASISQGKFGDAYVSEVNGRYYALAQAGKMFQASLQSAVALSSKSATCTGLILFNPYGSTVNLVLLDITVALATAPAGVSNIHLEGVQTPVPSVAAPTGNGVTVAPTFLGSSAASQAFASTGATLTATPTVIRAIGGGPNATGSVTTPFIRDEVAGQIIIGPGCSINLGYVTTAISVLATYVWAELPISG